MSEYVITTDNNSDLPEEYLKDHGVGCMYLSYSMDGKNYTHGNFLPEHEFYEAMRNGSMPTTAQVNPENAKALLEPYLKEGKDILHIAGEERAGRRYGDSCEMGRREQASYGTPFYSQRFKPPIPRRPHFQNYCSIRQHAEY